jgi:hypothetical protein
MLSNLRRALWGSALLCSCAAPATDGPFALRSWGTMAEVLREGHAEGRVDLSEAARAGTIAVGALEGLRGEVTVVEGEVIVAVPSPGNGISLRPPAPGERAALLILAQVSVWDRIPLPDCADYAALEEAIAAALAARGHDLAVPIPLRVRGQATALQFHVLDGACPYAQPDGPPPRRYAATDARVELVGFYAEGSGGEFTHHNHSSHLHAIVSDAMGHLDEVSLREAVLLLPRR